MSDKAVFKYVSTLNILICHTVIIILRSQWYLWEGDLWQWFLLMQLNTKYLSWDLVCIVIIKKAGTVCVAAVRSWLESSKTVQCIKSFPIEISVAWMAAFKCIFCV